MFAISCDIISILFRLLLYSSNHSSNVHLHNFHCSPHPICCYLNQCVIFREVTEFTSWGGGDLCSRRPKIFGARSRTHPDRIECYPGYVLSVYIVSFIPSVSLSAQILFLILNCLFHWMKMVNLKRNCFVFIHHYMCFCQYTDKLKNLILDRVDTLV